MSDDINLIDRLQKAAYAPLPDDDHDFTPDKARQAQAALQRLCRQAAEALRRVSS